jgi:hypothetical protein
LFSFEINSNKGRRTFTTVTYTASTIRSIELKRRSLAEMIKHTPKKFWIISEEWMEKEKQVI